MSQEQRFGSVRQRLERRNFLWQQLRLLGPEHLHEANTQALMLELMGITKLTEAQVLAGLGWHED